MKIKDTIHFNWYKSFSTILVIIFLTVVSFKLTDASFTEVFENSNQISKFMSKFMRPDFAYTSKILLPMLKTIQMSIVGTALGVLLALPISFLSTTIVTGNIYVSTFFRAILNLVRTIPTLLLASIFVALFGIGEITGVFTIAVFTFGMVSQLLYETIETCDHGPIEAAQSIGANKVQIAFWSIATQILPQIASYSLYAFEVNIRASTILGYVGAGGIGIMLNSSLALLRYDRVSLIILSIFVVVAIVDNTSESIRRKLL